MVGISSIAFGDIRINGDGRSGRLEFRDIVGWSTVCAGGFDDNAGEVACRQLGYVRSSDVQSYGDRYIVLRTYISTI